MEDHTTTMTTPDCGHNYQEERLLCVLKPATRADNGGMFCIPRSFLLRQLVDALFPRRTKCRDKANSKNDDDEDDDVLNHGANVVPEALQAFGVSTRAWRETHQIVARTLLCDVPAIGLTPRRRRRRQHILQELCRALHHKCYGALGLQVRVYDDRSSSTFRGGRGHRADVTCILFYATTTMATTKTIAG